MPYSVITLRAIDSWFFNHGERSIFDNIIIPDELIKDDLVATIFDLAGDFSVLHTDPNYYKNQTERWFRIHLEDFQKMIDALTAEYNPITDYSRKETRDIANTTHSEGEGASSGTSTGTETETTNYGRTDTGTVAAFNSSSYEPHEKNQSSGSDTSTRTPNLSTSGTTEHSADSTGEQHEIINIIGNIGGKSYQEHIVEELKLRKFNIYELIAEMYIENFCIRVY